MATRTAAQSAARSVRVNSTKRSKSTSQQTSRASHLSHHERKCFICRHPERETIEEMFIDWHSPMTIYSRFMLRDRRTIYDHAHALGLFAKRRRNMRCALERIIERADEGDVSPHGIVAAIKAYASLTSSGEWVEPARRVIYTSVSAPAPQREISNPLANQNGRRASHALIDPSVTGDGWYTRNERNSNPPANPCNKNGRSVYSAASDEPDLTGDGWYTRNERNSPPTYSEPQKTYAVYSDGSQAPPLPPVAANCPNPQPAPPSPTAAHISTSSTPVSSSQTAGTSAPNSHTASSPTANASAPAPAGRAPQTTTHTPPAPAHTTTTVAPTNPKSANSTSVRANAAKPANSSRYSPGLKIPATRTKQSPAPHPNRHK
ncbi:MAG: hypothetical protein ACRD4V_06670 [Candidatus Acidiferrales bacterium]